ncbi:PepSY-associated TM helix domain-containing protein [Polymorphobacter sp.]|uniref:PepSY-associated TM helix domain-containing protein n=1 Tax=Polymorphobacter sp. TaxID=1909290 RepID=UPI003F71FF31
MSTPVAARGKPRNTVKHLLMKQLHTWHWMSSAVSLVGLLLFAVTGITLNHAGEIEGTPVVTPASATMPASIHEQLAVTPPADAAAPLPPPVAAWLEDAFSEPATGPAEWSDDEVYLPLPRPGGDGWIAIDRATGAVTAETTDRGWISYLNDLHKGRNTGTAWKWFIDIFAVACVIFAATGFFLLQLHAGRRPSTWPLVAVGLVIPALIAAVLIH